MAGRALKIHVLDVGHGDSLIVEFPGGMSYGIIDCHHHPPSEVVRGEATGEPEPKALTFFRRVVNELKEGGKPPPVVEFVCLTHPHDDHYLGFPKLLAGVGELKVPILRVWEFPDCQQKTQAKLEAAKIRKERRELVDQAEDLAGFFLAVAAVPEWNPLDRPIPELLHLDQVVVHGLAPSKKHVDDRASYERMSVEERRLYFGRKGRHVGRDVNILSSVLLISYGKSHVILGGDLLNLGWKAILEDPKIKERHRDAFGKCIALKVSHHGSDGANFPYDPDTAEPLCMYLGDRSMGLVAAISGGYQEGLPGKKMIRKFTEAGIKVYCTGKTKGEWRLYIPQSISARAEKSIRSEFEMTGRARLGIEVDESQDPLHGDIAIICDDSEGWTVETETGVEPL